MSGPLTILSLFADSQKHEVNPADSATRTRASIATAKGSVFHTSSKKSAWIIDSSATNHMTFGPGQVIGHKSSTPSVDILTGKTIGCNTRPEKLYSLGWAPFTTSGTRSERERDKV
ncbi:hypothetical protein L3X38_026341 [Prunus dulcis]|uniref:Uncharacterized protein n=1 Tax=Prunus dulcis TaxID=3755 RepID=A0AAD4VKS1_PRUDU|nr:hypothetical protein L3X38_026341 [Prunus dulcis]